MSRTAEGATARKRSGTCTADSRDLWRATPPTRRRIHRRGAAPSSTRSISQVSRTEGRQAPRGACRLLASLSQRGCDGPEDSALRHPCLGAAPRSSISAAGTCRCTTARRSRSTTRCAATRACSTCRTCASSILTGARARDFLRYLLANDVGKLDRPGHGLYSCMLLPTRRRDRRSDRLLLDRFVVSPGGQRRHARQRSGLDPRARRRRSASRCASASDLAMLAVQGPTRATRPRRCCRRRTRPRRSASRRFVAPPRFGDVVRRAHRLHRRGRLRDHAAG